MDAVKWLLQPGVLTLLVLYANGYLFTYLLRHRLYIYAWARQVGRGTMRHVFILQNLEDVELSANFQLQVSTTNSVGKIRRAWLECGPGGPPPAERDFIEEGVQRRVLTIVSMPALDTWKVVVETNDEAGSIRLMLQGWDVRRNVPRWQLPTISRSGVSVRSSSAGSERELTRPAKSAVVIAGLMSLFFYAWLVHIGRSAMPEHGVVGVLTGIENYIWSVTPAWNWRIDGPIALVMLVIIMLSLGMVTSMHTGRIFVGFLGDETIEKELDPDLQWRTRATPPPPMRHFPAAIAQGRVDPPSSALAGDGKPEAKPPDPPRVNPF